MGSSPTGLVELTCQRAGLGPESRGAIPMAIRLVHVRRRRALRDLGPNDLGHLLLGEVTPWDFADAQPGARSSDGSIARSRHLWRVDRLGVVDRAKRRSQGADRRSIALLHRRREREAEPPSQRSMCRVFDHRATVTTCHGVRPRNSHGRTRRGAGWDRTIDRRIMRRTSVVHAVCSSVEPLLHNDMRSPYARAARSARVNSVTNR